MNTCNIDILKSISAVVNREHLTQEVYDILLKRWDLDKVDLDAEYIKIQTKQSNLTKSRREAVPEFIRIRDLLSEIKQKENNAIVMENNINESNNDQILIGGNV